MRITYLLGTILWAVGTTYGEYWLHVTGQHRVPAFRVGPRIEEGTETCHVIQNISFGQG